VSGAGLVQRALLFGRMIKFSHSVFALPFALASAGLAIDTRGPVPWSKLGWILVAMVGARSAAMGFNRLADQALDARNPRTAGRELPRGVLGRGEVWAFVLLAAACFVFAAAMLNPLCLALSPVALALVLGYSYTKRFTAFSHLVLGLGLSIAPEGAWLALRVIVPSPPVELGRAGMAWVAGFDVIYACQDVSYDRAAGLYSIPARLGVGGALRVSRTLHAAAVLLLASLYALAPLHPVYLAGVAAVAALLAYEHSLVREGDLSRVNAAFFAVNGWVAVGYLAFTLAARLLA
jgi:4-hydroxybenzoate polyprenyltransferase